MIYDWTLHLSLHLKAEQRYIRFSYGKVLQIIFICNLIYLNKLPYAFGKRLKHPLFRVFQPVIHHHPLTPCFVVAVYPQMQLRSDTVHRQANAFQVPTERLRLVEIPSRIVDYILACVYILCLFHLFQLSSWPLSRKSFKCCY